MTSNNAKPRLVFLFLVFFIGYSIIVVTLYRIQITHYAFYADLAEHQYNETITQLATRAPIYDRNGVALALNKDSLSAFIMPKQCGNFETVTTFIAKAFPDSLQWLLDHKDKNFVFIKRKLTKQEVETIKNSGIEDIHILEEPHRFYPHSSTATIIGLTDIDNKGVIGIELLYNKLLSGKPRTYSLKRDARMGHFYFKKDTIHKGKEGTAIKLTIDNDLQFLIEEELKETLNKFDAKEGIVIVMDPQSGDILSMVSFPHFDPHNTQQLDLELTKNRACTETYELGSVIKIFAALAALEEGLVTPDQLIDCKNSRTAFIDGRKVNTVAPHGLISFKEVLARSNNIGTATVVKELGPKLYDHYKRLGFTSKTRINLPGEQVGFVNHPQNWSKQSIFSLSYGYEISINLLQLAQALSIIANNGKTVSTQLIKEPIELRNNQQQEQLYSQKSIDALKDIMEYTTVSGTGRRAAIKGYRIMSKTGTANLLENGKYTPNKNIFTCEGILEKNNFRRVIVVFVKESSQKRLFSSIVAAPLFERVAEKVIIHEKII